MGPRTWYGDAITYGPRSIGNHAFYGMYNYDTIGATTVLNDSYYDAFHTVALHTHIGPSCTARHWPRPFEAADQYVLAAQCRNESYISWYLDGVLIQRVGGSAFDAFGSTREREVPQEPLYILLGLKLSPSRWGSPNDEVFPLHFEIDHVRLYQDASRPPTIGCSPESHPTEDWIKYHHIEFGVPGPSVASLAVSLAGAIVSLGIVSAFGGSLEMRPLVAAAQVKRPKPTTVRSPPPSPTRTIHRPSICDAQAVVLAMMGGSALFHCLRLRGLTWPAYVPALIASLFFSQLVAPLMIAAAAACAAAVAAAQASAINHGGHGPAPAAAIATPVCLTFVVYAVLAALCALSRWPRLNTILEAIGTAFAGSQALALGVGVLLSHAWVDDLGMRFAEADQSGDGGANKPKLESNVDQVTQLLASTLSLALVAATYQLALHGRRGGLRGLIGGGAGAGAGLFGGHKRRSSLLGRLLGGAGGEEESELDDDFEVVLDPDSEQAELERELERELDLERPSAASTGLAWIGLQSPAAAGGGSGVADHSELPPLETISAPLVRALGFQPPAVETAMTHLRSLLANAQRGGRTPRQAVEAVDDALLSNYRHWCRQLSVRPRTCSGEHAKLKGIALFLIIWSEAANLRHMPECLCWLFHSLCAYRSAYTATPTHRPSARSASPLVGTVVSYSFFASVVRPIVEVRHRLCQS